MEFFAEIKNNKLSINNLKTRLTIEQLPILCHSIDRVILDNQINGIIYCIWGEYVINREDLEYGIRFTLPHCPNSLAWTITCNEDHGDIIIHCTISKKTHEPDFIESIRQFVADWDINPDIS
ncbi:MAG: hypothetical protein COA54_01000 [Thiotrichaceae bacterium]|nr:MAG: hypothetical protein COA54_01000 [Thiotrichaceae bacterium]